LTPGSFAGQELVRIPVSPMLSLDLGNNEVLPLPCAIPAMINGFWNVRMCYKIVFAPPPTASMRMRVVYDAGDLGGYSHTISDNITFDLRATHEVTIKVDYLMPDNFMCRGDLFDPLVTSNTDPACHNGTILLTPESNLNGVELPNRVSYYVEAWVENCLYGNPTYGLMSNYTLAPWKTTGSKTPNDQHVLAYQNPFNNGGTGPTAPTPNVFNSEAPTPGIIPESTNVPAATNAPTLSTLATMLPSLLPTNSPSLRPTPGATVASSAPTTEFTFVSLPVELYGGSLNMSLVNANQWTSGDNTIELRPVMFAPGVQSVVGLDAQYTTLAGDTGSQFPIPDTSNNDTFSIQFTETVQVLSYSAFIPTVVEPYVLPLTEVATLTGGSITTWAGFDAVSVTPGSFNVDVPSIPGRINYLGVLFRGNFEVNSVAYGHNTQTFLRDRVYSQVFPLPLGANTVTINIPVADSYIVGLAYYRVKQSMQADDSADIGATMHVTASESSAHDLMRVHVGEWNQSLRTHVKVPMVRDSFPYSSSTLSQRTIYETDNSSEFSPMKMVLGMYGGYRGGMVSSLVFSDQNVRAYAYRGLRPEDTLGLDYRYRGNEVYATRVNQVVTAHFPYISRFRFIYGRESNHNVEDNYMAWNIDASNAGQALEYENVGEDFTPLYFLGPPVLQRL